MIPHWIVPHSQLNSNHSLRAYQFILNVMLIIECRAIFKNVAFTNGWHFQQKKPSQTVLCADSVYICIFSYILYCTFSITWKNDDSFHWKTSWNWFFEVIVGNTFFYFKKKKTNQNQYYFEMSRLTRPCMMTMHNE